jgi:hypothetical protein
MAIGSSSKQAGTVTVEDGARAAQEAGVAVAW